MERRKKGTPGPPFLLNSTCADVPADSPKSPLDIEGWPDPPGISALRMLLFRSG